LTSNHSPGKNQVANRTNSLHKQFMNPPSRITHADIAARAGCHQTTVSHALRGHPLVGKKTVARIQAIAAEMGYQPDPMMSALASYRSSRRPHAYQQTLALLTNRPSPTDWEAHPSGAARMRGLQRRARELGFRIDSLAIHPEALSSSKFARIARARNLLGLILAPTDYQQPEIDLDWTNFSAVSLGFSIANPALHRVGNTPFHSAQLATRELLRLGYRRIGLAIYKDWNRRLGGGVSAGFHHIGREHPEAVYSDFGVFPPDRWSAPSFSEWVAQFRPEAILTSGLQVEKWLCLMGLTVPQDVALADLDLAIFDGRQAGIDEHHEEVGAVSIEVLAALLARGERGIPNLARETLIEGTWVSGSSAPGRKLTG
jgi:DNA-binding LacI/PurR family transcriptional regulator